MHCMALTNNLIEICSGSFQWLFLFHNKSFSVKSLAGKSQVCTWRINCLQNILFKRIGCIKMIFRTTWPSKAILEKLKTKKYSWTHLIFSTLLHNLSRQDNLSKVRVTGTKRPILQPACFFKQSWFYWFLTNVVASCLLSVISCEVL